MVLTNNNPQLLSNDVLAKWLLEDFPFRIQLSSIFPFYGIAGNQLRYSNTDTLKPASVISFGDSILEDTKVPINPNRVFQMTQLATHFRVSYTSQDIFSSINDQVTVQMALAIRVLLYKFWLLFESGDQRNQGEFNGLLNLADSDNILDLKGKPLTLEILQSGKELIRANEGQEIIIFTSSLGKQAICAAHWMRGLKVDYQQVNYFAPRSDRFTQTMPSFDGSPIYINDLNQVLELPLTESSKPISPERIRQLKSTEDSLATNIWFLVMGKNYLHGINPASLDQMFVTRSTILPDESAEVYHITMPVGIALGSRGALAGIKNVTIPCQS